ncbi:hypothetical protein psal_cds_927 [Pandoravirus salinus]|uniref:Uncharacterized protein n=1 Tax=Pandoravirus salinus TaxID=1349410 RepID=S4W389_9VIRU|nr:hypothetical protein psal_cds_927 [Pandoravirus salinus]AGO85057.1 hypothetical protein psal_cds_927 [Pandoravirus salinus]
MRPPADAPPKHTSLGKRGPSRAPAITAGANTRPFCYLFVLCVLFVCVCVCVCASNTPVRTAKKVEMDAQRRLASLATLDNVVGAVATRNHRGVAMGVVASAVRARTGLGLDEWAARLAYPTWLDLVRALPCVRALVARGADWDVLPAALHHLPGGGAQWHRAPLTPLSKPAAPTPMVVWTARKCRKAIADLRRFPYVSLVVDASAQHDLGMIYLGARDGDGQGATAVCYAFDVHSVAPGAHWQGVAQIFGKGGLAWFLGDPAVPKVVCGAGPCHDAAAHAVTNSLARLACVPTADGAATTNLLVRGIVRALPLPSVDARNPQASSMALWARAGAAPTGDRWYWLKRPVQPHVLAGGAERAMILCAAYEAMQKAGACRAAERSHAAAAVTDSLLCVAAAQTAACAGYKAPTALGGVCRLDRDVSHPVECAFDGSNRDGDSDARVTDHAKRVHTHGDTGRHCPGVTCTDADGHRGADDGGDWDDLWRTVQRYMAATSADGDSCASAAGAVDGCAQDARQDERYDSDRQHTDGMMDEICGSYCALMPSSLWAYGAAPPLDRWIA